MKTTILIEDKITKRRREGMIECVAAPDLPGFVIIPWHQGTEDEYALTHKTTGRVAHLNPKTFDEIERYAQALSHCRIESQKVTNGETAEHYFVQRLSAEALEMAQA